MDIRETNSDYEMEKKIIWKFSLVKNVLRHLLFLEIVSVTNYYKLYQLNLIHYIRYIVDIS